MKAKWKIMPLLLGATMFIAQSAFANDGDLEICGYIDSISESEIVIGGNSYPLSSGTEYKDAMDQPISLTDLELNQLVEIKIKEDEKFVHEVEIEEEPNCSSSGSGSDDSSDDNSDDSSDDNSDDNSDDDSDDDSNGSGGKSDEQEICGQLTAITADSVSIGVKTFSFDSSTEFESKSGEHLTVDAFTLGDYVKAHIVNGDSIRELELDSLSGCKSYKDFKSSSKSSGSNSSSDTRRQTRLRTKLSAATGVSTQAKGQANYRSKAKRGEEKDRLQIKVEIPVPADLPALANPSEAENLTLRAHLERGDSTIAICVFEFDEMNDEGRAEYKIDIGERKGGVRIKKGSCDVDLAQPNDQVAVPPLLKGDRVVIILPDLSELLVGTF